MPRASRFSAAPAPPTRNSTASRPAADPSASAGQPGTSMSCITITGDGSDAAMISAPGAAGNYPPSAHPGSTAPGGGHAGPAPGAPAATRPRTASRSAASASRAAPPGPVQIRFHRVNRRHHRREGARRLALVGARLHGRWTPCFVTRRCTSAASTPSPANARPSGGGRVTVVTVPAAGLDAVVRSCLRRRLATEGSPREPGCAARVVPLLGQGAPFEISRLVVAVVVDPVLWSCRVRGVGPDSRPSTPERLEVLRPGLVHLDTPTALSARNCRHSAACSGHGCPDDACQSGYSRANRR